jgi:hypothetical protein
MTDLPPGAAWPPAAPDPAGSTPPDFTHDRVEEDAALSVEVARDAGGPPFQWPLVTVLVGLIVSLIVVADDHFRRGSVLFAAFVVLAFFLRLFLPERDAGWLAVRSKRIDLLCMGLLGIGLSVFALIVPPPS